MSVSRRDFLKVSSWSGLGLILGFHLPDDLALLAEPSLQGDGLFVPNAYLRISQDNLVTVIVHRSEMGQGVQTTIPMIVADELDADWSTIRVEQAPADRKYGDQVTGGSVSISSSYGTLRGAGAMARAWLVAAAAAMWSVDAESCRTENGMVIHDASGQQATYGQLVQIALTLPAPERNAVKLKTPEEFRFIGTRKGSINGPEFVTGKAKFASDIQLPGMLVAVVARCPVFGGKLASFDAARAQTVAGVRQVMEIPTGVAVVADSTWAAIKGRDALDITWDNGQFADLDSESIRQMAMDAIEQQAADNRDTVVGAATVVDALYEAPFLAHAAMEPMVCVADVRDDGCDVWAPTQDRQSAKSRAQSASHVSGEVNVHVPLVGGAFGRRIRVDYVEEAVRISAAVGAPVKVVWTRDDDIQHDFYRPASCHRMRASLDADGTPVTWEHYVASQGIGGSSDITQGTAVPYRIGKKNVRATGLSLPVPVGYWRSVFNTQNAYINECFLDEVAAASGQDPYEFRMALLDDTAPIKPVLKLAAEKADWGAPLPDGWGRGIACHSTWGATHVAQVAEVSISEAGELRVHRVVCALDCGTAVNPDMIEAQMEGGIAFALTSLLYGEITLKNGAVQQSGFNNYKLLRINEMPVVEVYILPSTGAPKGIGEMGNPPATPAIINAVYALTGKPIRRLPLTAEDLKRE